MEVKGNHELEINKSLGTRLLNIIVFFILCYSGVVHADDHGDSMATATTVGANSSTAGVLEVGGDLDVFRVVLSQPGDLRISTSVSTDTFGSLLNSGGTLLASDDDGGSNANFLLERTLSAGTYFIAVEGFDASVTGPYTLNLTFAASGGGNGAFKINPGLNDAWYYRPTDGQGFFITVFPSLGKVSLAWFTYDTVLPDVGAIANLGDPGHRWLTALGEYTDNEAVMAVKIASGGIFDTTMEVTRVRDGTIILTFDSCNSGTVEYDIPSIAATGIVPIERVVSDNSYNVALCEVLQNQ
jgi:hypothetical protein